jgi:hypothetical protein
MSNKTDTSFSLRIPKKLYIQLQQLAIREVRSTNEQIVYLIKQALEKEKK